MLHLRHFADKVRKCRLFEPSAKKQNVRRLSVSKKKAQIWQYLGVKLKKFHDLSQNSMMFCRLFNDHFHFPVPVGMVWILFLISHSCISSLTVVRLIHLGLLISCLLFQIHPHPQSLSPRTPYNLNACSIFYPASPEIPEMPPTSKTDLSSLKCDYIDQSTSYRR